ncbi:MAG: ribosome-associated translation inhibitor RaiA [Alphaproteobacteria bacterium]|nr:ribosome-associated translation inhibitor RaiA [Alphaproteobacteria bacterium]
MELSVKGKQMDVGDALREHVAAQLKEVVGKYFSESIDAQVTFSKDAHLFCSDIAVHAGRGMVIQGNASASEPYPAFDMALDRIAKQLGRYKAKLRDRCHNASATESMIANSFVLEGGLDTSKEVVGDNPVIVAEMTTPIETISVSEAVMRLDLGNLPALMFRNRANGGFNMIYRRLDGHIGWVDPSQNAGVASGKSKT